MWKMINRFAGHVLPGVIRPLHVLWNEMIGLVFLVLAAWAVPSAIRNIRQFDSADGGSLFRVVLSISFAGLMTYFAVSSFVRAKKISRS